MKVFELEGPVMRTIEAVINREKTAGRIPQSSDILFLEYEPDADFIRDADYDGAVAVYAPNAENLPESVPTGDQVWNEFLRVDCYGFGDPVPVEGDPSQYEPTVKEAQNRGQVLLFHSYNAIMNRQEIAGSASVPKAFGSTVDFGADKYPVNWQKFAPMGAMNTRRGAVVYRLTIRFKFDEEAIAEPLGLPFKGSDNVDSQTYNPGEEPEGA